MTMAVTPLYQLNRRIVEQGRLRMGEKNAKGEPVKLARYRCTSADKPALDCVAELYGGIVRPWPGAPTPEQFQVTIEAPKMRVVLPPDPMGDGPVYETWSAGGIQRRCDGVDCVTNASPEPVPCLCAAANRLTCKVTTRLNVILSDVPFGGVWRLESHGWGAAAELPGMIDLVLQVQSRGLAVAELGIAERRKIVNGQTKRFNVPVLTTGDLSIQQLASGLGTVSSLGRAPVRELEAGDVEADTLVVEDDLGAMDDVMAAVRSSGDREELDVEDAEIVDDPTPHASGLPGWQKALHAGIGDLTKLDDIPLTPNDLRHALVNLTTKGRTASSSDLTPDERRHTFDLIAELLAGERRYVRVDDGRLVVSRKRPA